MAPDDTESHPTDSPTVAALVSGLARVEATELFNPWADICAWDAYDDAPSQRRHRLTQHLDRRADAVLVGEAPSYQGARYTGIPFTAERHLMEGRGRVPDVGLTARDRLTVRDRPFSENSGTILWRCLHETGLAEHVVLWNALPFHPPGESVHSNRPPTRAELALGATFLPLVQGLYPETPVLAVGRSAETALSQVNWSPTAVLRHPARGGATRFRAGLLAAIASQRLSGYSS